MIASKAMRSLVGFIVGIGLAATAVAEAPLFTGVVFEDANGNGVRDSGEKGLAGIEVSNGKDVVLTDADGTYSLTAGPEAIFVVKPSGWDLGQDAHHLSKFYNEKGGDFALMRSTEADAFKVLVFTDTQPANAKELGYLRKTFVEPRIGKSECAFGVTLGDLTYDRPDMFNDIATTVGEIGIPWHNIPGNHDIAVLAGSEKDAVRAYEKAFGPSTYAFRYAHTVFIGIDDVRPRGGPRFIGGFTAAQLDFVGAVVQRTPAADLIVLMMHVELFPDPPGAESFRLADRKRLFDLLSERTHLLILSSHTHIQRHVLYARDDGWNGKLPLHEYNVAAASGGFWGGTPNADGIPASTMWDGTPPGSAVVTVTGNEVKLDYVPSQFPPDHQIGLFTPKVVAVHLGYVGGYANVYNAYKLWKIEARVDERAWAPMTSVLGWDPSYAAAFVAQDAGPKPAQGNRLPDPVLCNHLYRLYFPADLAVGIHHFQVRATDPYGSVYATAEDFTVAPR